MKDIIELISNKIMWPKEYHNFADKKQISKYSKFIKCHQ